MFQRRTLFSTGLVSALLVASLLLSPLATAEEIRGAGSTAAAKLYQSWAESFKTTGNQVNYAPVGSSAGIKAVITGAVDFGATDVPLTDEQMQKDGLICIPTAITGIVPAVNLPGVPQGKLRLSGPLLAAILTGKVHYWNDDAIRALNPNIRLPAEAIHVVARQDGSGSTWVLSKYLSAVSPEWAQEMGNESLLHWPASTLLARGSSGMADQIKQTPYSIGYLEPGYIASTELNYALVANKAGKYVQPDAVAFRAALAGSRWTFEGRFEDTLTNLSDQAAWPITTGTFIVMKRVAVAPKRMAIVANFLSGAFMQADNLAPKAGFVPLPMKTQARAVKTLGSMVEPSGVPLLFDVIWRRVGG
ncbi:MAG: phosphate transporter substrate-binding protein PhoT family [Proteobacteria bacterium]|nr:phosphate transporter substrate-binding protein PhoT family [Pseudomonadota bacterium]